MRLLLLSKTTGYQAQAFREAARKLGVPLTLGTDRCHVLDDPWRDAALPLRFENPEESVQEIANSAESSSITAIVSLGDQPALTGAMAAEKLGIRHHSPEGVSLSADKFKMRCRLQQVGVPVPRFARIPTDDPRPALPPDINFPCVLKPLGLAAGRGVIRADSRAEFLAAFERIRRLLCLPEIQKEGHEGSRWILVESFIEGVEYALEGVMSRGRLRTLAVFDKPDPLDGPFFEETIYVTPSRSPGETQRQIQECIENAAVALGLHHGPVHAEVRVNESGVWPLEVAARPIGGLCSRAVRFGRGISLEELLIQHALGQPVDNLIREDQAAGVMMIPVPAEGLFVEARGVDEALQVPNVDEVLITAKPKQKLLCWPEGNSYPGFIFARGDSPADVESALREAHRHLQFVVDSVLPVV